MRTMFRPEPVETSITISSHTGVSESPSHSHPATRPTSTTSRRASQDSPTSAGSTMSREYNGVELAKLRSLRVSAPHPTNSATEHVQEQTIRHVQRRRTSSPPPPIPLSKSASTSTIYVWNMGITNTKMLTCIGIMLHTMLQEGNDALMSQGHHPMNFHKAADAFDDRTYFMDSANKKSKISTIVRISSKLNLMPRRTSEVSALQTAEATPDFPAIALGDVGMPEVKVINKFIFDCRERAHLSIENMIVALILVNRIILSGRMHIHMYNWRLTLLTALLIAQKINDDVPLDNASFPVLWRYALHLDDSRLKTKHFNAMEVAFYEIIEFRINISKSLYTSFTLELRDIYQKNHHFGKEEEFPELAHADVIALVERNTNFNPKDLEEVVKYATRTYCKSKSAVDTVCGPEEGFGSCPATMARAVLS